jgi:hypothetical protein
MPRSFRPKSHRLWKEKNMKKRIAVVLGALCLFALAAFAADANVGTWNLNEAKSKIPAGTPKNTKVVYTVSGDQFECTIDGVDAQGKPLHSTWTGKFDGKDYPVAGDPSSDSRSIQKIDSRHYKLHGKKDGKTNLTGEAVISEDGKTRTVTIESTDAAGKKQSRSYVYDKG